jgi:5-methylthioadenosine/S-adenosylhomocysteine deaminase
MCLHEWLNDAIWPVESKFVCEDFIDVGIRLAVHEMLKSGTTLFIDNYFYSDVAACTVEKVGIRMACGEPIIDFHDVHLHAKINTAVSRAEHFLANHHSDYIIPILNPHACYSVPEDGLEIVSARAKSLGRKVNIHLHESQHECDKYADTHFGRSAFQTLADADLLNENLIAAHCVCLDRAEQELLATHKVNVVHCPKSNMKLASGICPVQSLIDCGVNVALGTDGACSNNSLNMISEMQAAALIGKTVPRRESSTEIPENRNGASPRRHGSSSLDNGGDATAVSCHTVLRMATWNGAVAIGMQDKIGSLEIGKFADIVAIDLSAPECNPIFDPVSALVYTSSPHVSHVWIGGRHLVHEGQVVSTDLQLDMERVKAIGKTLHAFKLEREKIRKQRTRLES